MEDTIVAISTSLGVGAISIVRVSGEDAIEIVDSIFSGQSLKEANSHTIHYGQIIDNNNIIDEVLVSVMKAPKTYTKEDIVEINCHGGIMTTKKVLELLIIKGCRLAEPGEFTKRAFLNGRIDLTEATGVMDLIDAKTENQRKMAINKVNGNVSSLIKDLRNDLALIISNIEVNIDYPEYDDVTVVTNKIIEEKIGNIKERIEKILKESESGKLLKEGIKTAIIGKPNVGKSSLLNCLIEEEKAIVTDIEGTTRDIVEGTLNINGLILNILDTAGIRKTENVVEKIGVEKSIELIDESDLILFVLNNNEKLTEEEKELYKKIKDKNHIIILNKVDLENKLDLSLFDEELIKISAKNNEGIKEVRNQIEEMYDLEQIEKGDFTYLTNADDIATIKKCLNGIDEIIESLNNNVPVDLIEIDIKKIWELLGQIIGESYDNELIDYMFSHFCLGK